MKLLISLTIWVAAILFAGFVLWRLIRRKPMLLHGSIGRRAVRLAAVVMVGLGFGGCATEEQQRAAPPKTDPLDLHLDRIAERDDAVPVELGWYTSNVLGLASQRRGRSWENNLEHRYQYHHRPNLALVAKHLRRERQDPSLRDEAIIPLNARIIADAAVEMRSGTDVFDEPFCITLWHLYQQLPPPRNDTEAVAYLEALDALRVNARMLNALTHARFRVGLTMQRDPGAWQSKGGPRSYILHEDQQAFSQAAAAHYPIGNLGLWDTEGIVWFTTDAKQGGVERLRPPGSVTLRPGGQYRLGRLDLLRTGDAGGRLIFEWLGPVELPPDRLLRVSELAPLLTEDARQRIGEVIEQAIAGDDAALLQLERHMPLCLPQVLAAVNPAADEADDAQTPGTAGLRFLVYLYDPLLLPNETWAALERRVRTEHDQAVWLHDDGLSYATQRPGPPPGTVGPGGIPTGPQPPNPGGLESGPPNHPGGTGRGGGLEPPGGAQTGDPGTE